MSDSIRASQLDRLRTSAVQAPALSLPRCAGAVLFRQCQVADTDVTQVVIRLRLAASPRSATGLSRAAVKPSKRRLLRLPNATLFSSRDDFVPADFGDRPFAQLWIDQPFKVVPTLFNAP